MIHLETALEESRSLGFLGPGPVQPHLAHAEAFASVVEGEPARALDLGAGGGLPGLVLAARRWPSTSWTFLDAQTKRTSFLERAVDGMGLGARVIVVNQRAEETGRDPVHRGGYDLVTSRSFGPPAVTAECAAPLLADGGLLVVSEPPESAPDRWPAEGLARLGLAAAERLVVDASGQPVHLVRIRRMTEVTDRYPRRVGIPNKRPLF